MQVFMPEYDVLEAVQCLDDVRLGKQALEGCQVLATVLQGKGRVEGLYKPTHAHHPITKWAGVSADNFLFLYGYTYAVCLEWAYRKGKHHGCLTQLLKIYEELQGHNFDYDLWTAPPWPKPEECKKLLTNKWENDKIKLTWTKRNKPTWAMHINK